MVMYVNCRNEYISLKKEGTQPINEEVLENNIYATLVSCIVPNMSSSDQDNNDIYNLMSSFVSDIRMNLFLWGNLTF